MIPLRQEEIQGNLCRACERPILAVPATVDRLRSRFQAAEEAAASLWTVVSFTALTQEVGFS